MSDVAPTKSMADFQKELRGKFYGAVAAAVVAGFGGALFAGWTYLSNYASRAVLIPKGAVIAFWTEPNVEQANACPSGWTLARDIVGRVLVGAGQTDATWQRYVDSPDTPNGELIRLTRRPPRSIGGEENHILTVRELPSHDHEFQGNPINAGGWGGAVNQSPFSTGGPGSYGSYTPSGRIRHTGENRPHNNMPPFIALFYCVKD